MRILILFLLFQSNEFLSDRVLIQDHQHRRRDGRADDSAGDRACGPGKQP